VGYIHSTNIKFNLINLRLLKRLLGRPKICITRANEKYIFRNLEEIRKNTSKNKGRRDLNLLSLGTFLIHINEAR